MQFLLVDDTLQHSSICSGLLLATRLRRTILLALRRIALLLRRILSLLALNTKSLSASIHSVPIHDSEIMKETQTYPAGGCCCGGYCPWRPL